jgi:hypothetical protein
MRRVFLGLFVAGALFAQPTPFERLKREAASAKALPSDKDNRDAVMALHAALRDWIESRLPQTPGIAELHNLETDLKGELEDAGLGEPDAPASTDGPEGPGLGYVGLEFKWLPELPDTLAIVAGVRVECGSDEAVYFYRFDATGRARVFEDRPESAWGYTGATLAVSDPDSQGRRLLLTHYYSVQCASSWMGMAYSVYRVGPQSGASELLLRNQHGFYLNDGPEFVLKPDELIIEFLDSSVDLGVHNRTNIQRYTFGAAVQRLDPVAFQPQDFAEEWLTRGWNEMDSRSAAETKEWHERLSNDYVRGEYSGVIPCTSQSRWLIALEIERVGDKEMPDPKTTYFLVHDLGNYHYKMDAVSKDVPVGCLGARDASDKHPWLSTTELKALK